MSKLRRFLRDLLILFNKQGGNLFSVFVIAVFLLYRKQKDYIVVFDYEQ